MGNWLAKISGNYHLDHLPFGELTREAFKRGEGHAMGMMSVYLQKNNTDLSTKFKSHQLKRALSKSRYPEKSSDCREETSANKTRPLRYEVLT